MFVDEVSHRDYTGLQCEVERHDSLENTRIHTALHDKGEIAHICRHPLITTYIFSHLNHSIFYDGR